MAIIDSAALSAEIEKKINTPKVQKDFQKQYVDIVCSGGHVDTADSCDYLSPQQIAEDFRKCLIDNIRSCGLPNGVENAIQDWRIVGPKNIDGKIFMFIMPDADLHRSSLSNLPKYAEGIHDLAELYNNGAKGGKRMKQVYGIWHGERVGSRTVIPGAHFFETTERSFLREYIPYGLKDVCIEFD